MSTRSKKNVISEQTMFHCISSIKYIVSSLSLTLNSRRKDGNVLFNDAFNTFYLRLYGVGHMVKDHSDNERGNLLQPHGLLLLISSEGSFYMHHSTDRIAHTTRPLSHQSWSTGWNEK